MSLTFGQLRTKVEAIYPEVQQVAHSVLRYTRTADQSEFAVYYLDLGETLPQTKDKLDEYLDRVVGKYYFQGASSLQWNSYLYFIRNPDQFQDMAARKARDLVERDRAYARKYVISESELDSVLYPDLDLGTSGSTPDPISPWHSILQRASLVEAVFGEHTLPERMQLVERPPTVSTTHMPLAITSSGTLLPPIRQFEIQDYRPCLTPRAFDFRDVNLLFGANGTGKTSLLEAIELLYCGKTRRNPKVSENYRFQVSDNGNPRLVSHGRPLQLFRDCNLEWYGIREERTTNVFDGFGRFNFLNTDAAIELSQSAEKIDEDLAKLLVGPEAAKTWQVIEKLAERIGDELRGLRPLRQQVRREINVLTKQLEKTKSIRKESDSLRSALREALCRNQWTSDDEPDLETGKLIAALAELNVAAEQAGSLRWLNGPVTLDTIESYCKSVESVIEEYTPLIGKFMTVRINQQQLTMDVQRDQKALTLIDELAMLVESEIEPQTVELAKQRETIAAYNSLLAGLDEDELRVVAGTNGNLAADDYRDSTATSRKRAEDAVVAAKREYSDFVKLRDRSLSLAQELRAIAARILEESLSNDCPLCHTKFPAGELAHHMAAGVDEHTEAAAQQLLTNVRHADVVLNQAAANEKVANQIGSLCTRLQLSPKTVLNDVIVSLNEAKTIQAEAQRQAEALAHKIGALEAQGLSLARLNEVSNRLSLLGISLAARSRAEVNSLRGDIEQRLVASRSQMEANAQKEGQLQTSLTQAVSGIWLSRPDPSAVMDPSAVIAELEKRLATTRTVSTTLRDFLPRFRWEGSQPIVEWAAEAGKLRGIAAQLQAALEEEGLTANTRSDAARQRDELQQQDRALTGRARRLNEAGNALTEIQANYSLKAMTESALQVNRQSIETIFAQIHSPAEFKAIGQDWKLVRKLDEAETPLTMISTGQRAAFALAVFLAQNAELRSGPRVILIDDPIAHVDDLNCLSFLDYLREVALTGTRQIFFATANDKLASLFERKFDFLRDRFKRFDMTRTVVS